MMQMQHDYTNKQSSANMYNTSYIQGFAKKKEPPIKNGLPGS